MRGTLVRRCDGVPGDGLALPSGGACAPMGRMKYPCVCIEFRRHHLTGEAGTMVYGESLQAFVHPCAADTSR